MPKFSDRMLEQVRSIGIERIVDPYVELRAKHGTRDLWGLCPFHNENSPSFKIDTERGFFKCFGCDAKGDGITFIMRRLGFAYADAVVFIAEKYGINVEYDGEDSKYRKDIASLHEDVQGVLRQILYSKDGREAKEYILNRDFTEEDLNDFGVGYALPRYDYSDIIKKYGKEVAAQSGFFKEGNYGLNTRFFGRLTLPIKNITGSIAAFAGRSLDGSNPKYLNSSESELFHKRYTLFNIDKAKDAMKKAGSCIVVEGYFDVMRLCKSGYVNSVAPMGTALTLEQINLIKRYTSEIVVIFDGDEAGEKAAYRSLENFITAGVFPKAVFLPQEEDPDSFIIKYKREGFNKVFMERDDLFINVSKRLAKSAGNDFNKKLMRFQSVKKMLAKTEDPHLRDHYSNVVSDIFGLKKENIEEDIMRERYKKSFGVVPKAKPNTTMYACEMDFIACISRLPVDVIDSIICDMSEDMFNSQNISEIFKKILEFYADVADINDLAHELGADFVEIAMRDIGEYTEWTQIQVLAIENKRQIVKNYLKKKQSMLISRMKAADDGEKLIIIKELDDITRQLAVGQNTSGV